MSLPSQQLKYALSPSYYDLRHEIDFLCTALPFLDYLDYIFHPILDNLELETNFRQLRIETIVRDRLYNEIRSFLLSTLHYSSLLYTVLVSLFLYLVLFSFPS